VGEVRNDESWSSSRCSDPDEDPDQKGTGKNQPASHGVLTYLLREGLNHRPDLIEIDDTCLVLRRGRTPSESVISLVA